MLRTARFLHSYLTHPTSRVSTEEVDVRAGGDLPGTLFRPRGAGPFPGWVVLHGMTVPGREHASLQRFARALSGSGALVLLPEIAAWRDLRLDPEETDRVIADSSDWLARQQGVLGGGVGVVGFSFGATQALITAASPGVHSIRAVVAFGGYCEPVSMFRFAFTGEHEWKGTRYRLAPDPYGRWVIAANYLRRIPEYADLAGVEAGARELALDAGRRGAFAGDPIYDEMKARLRSGLRPAEREVWDLIAPASERELNLQAARALAERLVQAALATHPGLDPRPVLPRMTRAVVLAHGYHDQLVPFTETLRLRGYLPAEARTFVRVTRLFAHSKEAPRLPLWQLPIEMLRYVGLLRRAFSTP